MSTLTTIGSPRWNGDDIVAAISEFEAIYESRPIADNQGGMRSPHMFAAWFMARQLAPECIVESGIWLGQSTWLFEQACPNARMISIDIDLSHRKYVSPHVTYFDRDFGDLDWSDVPTESTLLFFDDHQNAYHRLQQCKWFGFRDVMFEDNYPESHGDCYSLKKAFAGAGFAPPAPEREQRVGWIASRLARELLKLLDPTARSQIEQYSRVRTSPNQHDAKELLQNLELYYEFPPVFKTEATRWGDAWSAEEYPTPDPVLDASQRGRHPVFWDDAVHYTWMCYARLKAS